MPSFEEVSCPVAVLPCELDDEESTPKNADRCIKTTFPDASTDVLILAVLGEGYSTYTGCLQTDLDVSVVMVEDKTDNKLAVRILMYYQTCFASMFKWLLIVFDM